MTQHAGTPVSVPARRWVRRLLTGALWALLWLPVGIELGISRPWTRNPPCQSQGEGEVLVSPEGALAAQMLHEICDYGWIFLDPRSRLEAWRVAAPEQRHVLAGWSLSSVDDVRSLAWTGAGALRLELAASRAAGVRSAPLAGVSLTVVQAAPAQDAQRARDAER